MIKIVQINVIIAVKLLGMSVRFFQMATNKKILSKIMSRKIDRKT